MGAAHGCFIYLTKLHLKVSQSLLTQEIWADAWDSFAFFCHSCGVEIRALRAKIIRVLRTKISFLNLTRHVKATYTAFLHVD